MGLTRPTAAQINTVVTTISDPITVLNQGSTAANIDVGFIINRNGGSLANTAIFWDESANTFVTAFTTATGVTNANINIAQYANLSVGSLTATPAVILANTTTANTTTIVGSTGGNYTVTLPPMTGTVASLGSTTQTFLGAINVNGVVNFYGITQNYGAGGTSSTVNISTVALASGNTKAINIGTSGAAGSNTNIVIGPTDGNGNIFIHRNAPILVTNTAAATSTTTGALRVDGGVGIGGNLFAGNVSATYFTGSGQFLTGLPASYSNVNVKAYTESMGFQNYGNVNVAALITTNGLTNYSNVNVAAYTQTQSYTNYSNVNLSAYLGGAVTIGGNLTINGNLFVNGNLTTINANNLTINDSMIYLADDNPADVLDIGLVSAFTSPVRYQHTGFVRDATDGVWKLFANVVTEPTTTIDFTNANYSSLYVGNIQTVASANIGSTLNVVGNVLGSIGTFSALTVNGFINTSSNVSAAVHTGGAVSVTGFINTSGNISGAVVNAGALNATGTTTLVAVNSSGFINTSGNVSAAVHTGGAVSVTGFINTSGNVSASQINSATAVVTGSAFFGELFVKSPGGDEGGQINLANAVTNTTLVGNVVIDVFQNKLRIFEGGGTARGGYFDISGLAAGVATNLAAGGGGGTPGGGPGQLQFNSSSAFAGAASLYYFGANGAIVANAGIASTSTTTGTFQVTGGIGVTGTVTAGSFNTAGNILAANINAGGVRQTTGTSVPTIASVGDQWYDTATDILFKYTYDGTNFIWVDIGSVALNTNIATIQGTTLSITGNGTVATTFTSGAHTITGNPVTALINGGTAGVGNIGASGQGFNTVFAKATSAQYADLAEKYTSDHQYDPGIVLVFGGTQEVTQSTTSHDPAIAGVVSTNPAYLMNSGQSGVSVALTGRVPCWVRGPINKGDRVVSSDMSGIAECLNLSKYQPGCIIGKSLETIEHDEVKLIEVVVGRI